MLLQFLSKIILIFFSNDNFFFSLHIGEFERVRYYLKKFKLIKDGPTSIEHSCGEDGNKKNKGCVLGYATHSCATKVSFKILKLSKNFPNNDFSINQKSKTLYFWLQTLPTTLQ